MATGGHPGRQLPLSFQHESESSDIDMVTVRMPDGSTKKILMPMLPNAGANTPREKRLGLPSETVRDLKHRLLREDDCPETTFNDYEMLLVGPQGISEVMPDDNHTSTYRTRLGTGRDIYLEIRKRANQNRDPRPSHPEDFGYELK